MGVKGIQWNPDMTILDITIFLPWVPEGFFVFVLFCGDSDAAHCRRKTKQKNPSGTQGRYSRFNDENLADRT